MAIIRLRELKEMDAKALSEKLAELRRELSIERGSTAGVGRTVNPGRIRAIKRTIARILTIATAKGLKLAPVKRARPKPESKKEVPVKKEREEKKKEAVQEKEARPVPKNEVSPEFSEIMGEVRKKEKT